MWTQIKIKYKAVYQNNQDAENRLKFTTCGGKSSSFVFLFFAWPSLVLGSLPSGFSFPLAPLPPAVGLELLRPRLCVPRVGACVRYACDNIEGGRENMLLFDICFFIFVLLY